MGFPPLLKNSHVWSHCKNKPQKEIRSNQMTLFTRKISEFLIKLLVKDSDYLKIWISTNVNYEWLCYNEMPLHVLQRKSQWKTLKTPKWSTKLPILNTL